MRRKFTFILLTLIMLGTIGYFYVNKVLLPVKIKSFVSTKAEELLGRKTNIGSVSFKPMKGFILNDIDIAQKANDSQSFIQIKEASFNIVLGPIFKSKNIVIPTINILQPSIHISRDQQSVWNFSDLLTKDKPKTTASEYKLLARTINIEDGQVDYKDNTQDQLFLETIKDIDLKATLTLSKNIDYTFSSVIPSENSQIAMSGKFDIATKANTSHLELKNIPLAKYYKLMKASDTNFKSFLQSASVDLTYRDKTIELAGDFALNNTDIAFGQELKLKTNLAAQDASLTWQNNSLSLNGLMTFSGAQFKLRNYQRLDGDFVSNIKSLTYSNQQLNFDGSLKSDNFLLALSQDTSIKGRLNTTNALFSKKDNLIDVSGNYILEDALIALSKEQTVKGDIQFNKARLTYKKNNLNVQGDLTLNKALINVLKDTSVAGNIKINDTQLTYINKELELKSNINIDQTQIDLKKTTTINGIVTAPNTELSYRNKTLDVKTDLYLKQALIKFKDTYRFQGDPHLKLIYTSNQNDTNQANYNGILNLSNATLRGIPKIDSLENINGVINIAPEQIDAQQLSLSLQDIPLGLKGVLSNFTYPTLNIVASATNVDFQKLTALYPDLTKKLDGDLTGSASFKASIVGPAKSLKASDIRLTALLNETTIATKKLPENITINSGELDYADNIVVWKNLKANFKDHSLVLNGELTNFSQPIIKTNVKSKEFDFLTNVQILKDQYKVLALNGRLYNSQFNLTGDVYTSNESPLIDLVGQFELDLLSLPRMLPKAKDKLVALKLDGVVTGDGRLNGTLNNWRDWNLNVSAQSELLSFKNTPFKDLDLTYNQSDQQINEFNLSSTLYNGALNVAATGELTNQIPVKAAIKTVDLNLATLRTQRDVKNKHLAGKLNLDLNVNGPLLNLTNLTGDGRLTIKEGYLWSKDLISGLSGVLLIPEYQKLIFTAADADLKIENRRVTSSNAQIFGNNVNLQGSGWIDFDQNLNFDIKPQFSEIVLAQSESLKKAPTSLITQVLRVKLTGTVKRPVYDVEKSPIKIIGNTVGEIGNILGDLF